MSIRNQENGLEESDSSLENFIDFKNRLICIYDVVTPKTSLDISLGIKKLEQSLEPIRVKINSEGGDFAATLSICTDLINCPCHIITDVTGIAFSAGSMILLCGKERICSKVGTIMFHSANIEIENTIEKVRNFILSIKENDKRIMGILLKDTKLSYGRFKKLCGTRDWYLTPDKALLHGVIHKIY